MICDVDESGMFLCLQSLQLAKDFVFFLWLSVALKCSGCVVVSLREDPTPYLRDSKSIIYKYI